MNYYKSNIQDLIERIEQLEGYLADADLSLAHIREELEISYSDDEMWDYTWVEYHRNAQKADNPQNFTEADEAWLANQSPTPVRAAVDLDRLIANPEAVNEAMLSLADGQPRTPTQAIMDCLDKGLMYYDEYPLGYWA